MEGGKKERGVSAGIHSFTAFNTHARVCSTYPVCSNSKVLQVLQQADVGVDTVQVVVAQVEEAQLAAEEEMAGDLIDLVAVQVEALEVNKRADLNWDVGDLIVPELQAHQPVQVLEADDLLDCLQVVVLQVNLL